VTPSAFSAVWMAVVWQWLFVVDRRRRPVGKQLGDPTVVPGVRPALVVDPLLASTPAIVNTSRPATLQMVLRYAFVQERPGLVCGAAVMKMMQFFPPARPDTTRSLAGAVIGVARSVLTPDFSTQLIVFTTGLLSLSATSVILARGTDSSCYWRRSRQVRPCLGRS